MGEHCFVHAADLHLDTPFEGVRAHSPQMAELLRDASLDAFDRLVELTLERQAAFLAIAGDVYDGAERGLRAQLRFRDGLARLSEAGIATFVVHGNHDPVEEGWQAIRDWPPHVTVFGSHAVETHRVDIGGAPFATVHGISYPQRVVTENLARRFARTDEPGLHVGVLHATVGDQPEHDPYAPCSLDDLRAARMDYWALGHIHRRQVLLRGDPARGEPWVVYAGNTQGRSPKPSERGAKGALVVGVDTSGSRPQVTEPEFVALDLVRFAEVTIDVSELRDLGHVTDELAAAAARAHADADGRALVLRGRLVGRGEAHRDLTRTATTDDLVRSLRDAARGLQPPLWWERVRDESRPPLDREALRAGGDLRGEVVRLVDRLRDDPEHLARVGADAEEILDRLRPTPEAAALVDLLDEAEIAALDALGSPDEPGGA